LKRPTDAVSHAYAHLEEFGEPVEIGGLMISSGDLLHGIVTESLTSHSRWRQNPLLPLPWFLATAIGRTDSKYEPQLRFIFAGSK